MKRPSPRKGPPILPVIAGFLMVGSIVALVPALLVVQAPVIADPLVMAFEACRPKVGTSYADPRCLDHFDSDRNGRLDNEDLKIVLKKTPVLVTPLGESTYIGTAHVSFGPNTTAVLNGCLNDVVNAYLQEGPP